MITQSIRQSCGSQVLREHINQLYQNKGLQFLALFPEGWQVWTTKKEVRRPEDFSGLKMRVMTSPMLLRAYAAYGANPTPLPYAEVYIGILFEMWKLNVRPLRLRSAQGDRPRSC